MIMNNTSYMDNQITLKFYEKSSSNFRFIFLY